MLAEDVVLFSSYAKLPVGTVSENLFHVMALVVLVDMNSGKIVDAECTLSTRLSERFDAELLRGRDLAGDWPELLQDLSAAYQGNSKKTIISALRSLHDKYVKYLRERENDV